MSRVLVVGATRGLGASLTKLYARDGTNTVYGTTRADHPPTGFADNVKWLTNVDLMQSNVGDVVVQGIGKPEKPLDSVIIAAGHFTTEDLLPNGPNWEEQVRMYTTSSVAPVFIVQRLVAAGLLGAGSKVVLVSSESGSIALRHPSEGGGNYGHHASKAALNMAGRLLALDLQEKEIVVTIVHPGFMRTEMTKGVGFDKFWDDGGAVTPDEAAASLADWIATVDIGKTGEYWAPRGPGDIGTARDVLGSNLQTPLKLPW